MGGTRIPGHEELQFKGKMPIGQPVIWWLSQVLEERKELARKQKGMIVDRWKRLRPFIDWPM